MEVLLLNEYGIHVDEKILLLGKECFLADECLYFTIVTKNRENIHLEQAALAYYLYENNYLHIARPIPTTNGEWFSTYGEERYIVLKVDSLQVKPTYDDGILLANFHNTCSSYRYEPQLISSYGQWKQLWVKKLTYFEQKLLAEAKEHSSDYYRDVTDILPYIIGITENAIQYVHESESEHRYHEGDQGTIAFRRYENNLVEQIIWMNDLVFDHPVRDLAEYTRIHLLQDNYQIEKLLAFFANYQTIRPLSVFSWRLLYGRLIYPSHIFDCLENGLNKKVLDQNEVELRKIIEKQPLYERRLSRLFDDLSIDFEAMQIPVLHWLK